MSNIMETWDTAYFEQALKWDDDYAPMECPGCLGNIEGWTKYAAHQTAPGPGLSVGFIEYAEMSRVTRPLTVCPWDTSKLSARVHYRAYVDKWRGLALWGRNPGNRVIRPDLTGMTGQASTSETMASGSTEPAPSADASASSATPGS